jgi:hypothetical protein
MLAENRFTHHMVHAIGEIVLVVVGICRGSCCVSSLPPGGVFQVPYVI